MVWCSLRLLTRWKYERDNKSIITFSLLNVKSYQVIHLYWYTDHNWSAIIDITSLFTPRYIFRWMPPRVPLLHIHLFHLLYLNATCYRLWNIMGLPSIYTLNYAHDSLNSLYIIRLFPMFIIVNSGWIICLLVLVILIHRLRWGWTCCNSACSRETYIMYDHSINTS